MLTAQDVAEFFLSRSDVDDGEFITHLKLQKLCYYAQGFGLAIYDTPLFNEPIEAWEHGPVVPTLWHQYKGFGANGIPAPEMIDLSKYSEEAVVLLEEVYDVYGQYSAWKLRTLTHSEKPWIDAFNNGTSKVIELETMRTFFKTLLEE